MAGVHHEKTNGRGVRDRGRLCDPTEANATAFPLSCLCRHCSHVNLACARAFAVEPYWAVSMTRRTQDGSDYHFISYITFDFIFHHSEYPHHTHHSMRVR